MGRLRTAGLHASPDPGFTLIFSSMAMGGSLLSFFDVPGPLILVRATFAATLINERISHVLGRGEGRPCGLLRPADGF